MERMTLPNSGLIVSNPGTIVSKRLTKMLRLARCRGWWYAHRDELPDFKDALIVLLTFVLALAVFDQYDTYQLRQEAKFVSESAGRFKACLEGRRTLGSVEEYGATWDIECKTVMRKRI